MSSGLISASTCSSSASLGCRGKAAGLVLQVLRAQQRKLRVRSFIFACGFLDLFLSKVLFPRSYYFVVVGVVAALTVDLFSRCDGSLLLPETLRANQKRRICQDFGQQLPIPFFYTVRLLHISTRSTQKLSPNTYVPGTSYIAM